MNDKPAAPARTRRDFLKTGAAASAAAVTLPAASYARIGGANERIHLAFLGVGGRCQQHIDVILAMRAANNRNVAPVAVCDVWDGNPQLGRRPDGGFNGRGLFPSARRRKPYAWDIDPETAGEIDRLFGRLQAALTMSTSPLPR